LLLPRIDEADLGPIELTLFVLTLVLQQGFEQNPLSYLNWDMPIQQLFYSFFSD
jgi:hypothetical protein